MDDVILVSQPLSVIGRGETVLYDDPQLTREL
jgi:hypothetical protein